MLQTKQVTKKMDDFQLVHDLYMTAFPPKEREPLSILLGRAKQGAARFEAYYDDGVFVGLSSVTTQGDLSYVQYLAVVAAGRSKGYGGQILSHIKDTHPHNRIFLNMEVEDETADNAEQRKKRRAFYLKNGYAPTGLNMSIAGNMLEVVILNGTCTGDEVYKFFRKYFGFIITKWLRVKVWEIAR